MSRNSVKVMIYSYFLNLKSYINTYISVTYTESTVSNIKPKGNHNSQLTTHNWTGGNLSYG